jgi:CSLREA domain-containing protein
MRNSAVARTSGLSTTAWSALPHILLLALLVSISLSTYARSALGAPLRDGAVLVVNSTDDQGDEVPGDGECLTSIYDGVCTLRAAIEEANALAGYDFIDFNISGSGVHTIAPAVPLPDITDPVLIDGYTQPGASPNSREVGNNAVLLIEIDGSQTEASALRLLASNSVIRGLVINRSPGAAIVVTEANNIIVGNFIGTNPAGTVALGNLSDGIFVANLFQPTPNTNTRIGGPNSADRNLISGNGYNGEPFNQRNGITADQVHGTIIQNNYIGTDRSGAVAIPNAQAGVGLYRGQGHLVDGNIISGHSNPDLVIGRYANGIQFLEDLGGSNNGVAIKNNLIGLTADGSGQLPNGGRGISVMVDSGFATATIANNTVANSGHEGIYVFGSVAGSAEGNTVRNNGSDGVSIAGDAAIELSGNAISGNGGEGIDLGADGITFNHAGFLSGPNSYQNYPLIEVATVSAGNVRVAGSLASADGTYRIEFFANDSCDPAFFGEGQTYIGGVNVTTSGGSGSFDTVVTGAVTEGQGLSATATRRATGETSEFSYCRPVSSSNTSWVNATPIALEGFGGVLEGSASQRIMEVYQEKWFRFPVQPGDKVRITLDAPAGSAISLHRDPLPFYNRLTNPSDVAVLAAETTDVAFLPAGALPPGTLPSGSLPGGTLPSGSLPPGTLPGGFLPGGLLPSGSLPPGSLPGGALPPGSLPGGALPPGSLPGGAVPPGTLPGGSLPPGALPGGSVPPGSLPGGSLPPGSLPGGSLPPGALADAYSGSARRSLMAVSLDPYATRHVIERNTYDLDENLYLRVVGPYYPNGAFTIDVELKQGICAGVLPVAGSTPAISGAQPGDTDRRTLILTDSARLSGSESQVTTALARLNTLAGRSDVSGVVVNLADGARFPGVAFANAQADANPGCPSAKNKVAREIKRIVDVYRAANVGAGGKTTLEYIVIAGNRSVVPFFQAPDVAGMANEREYVPPVAANTPTEAGLKVGLVQGQDYYGSSVALDRGGRLFFVPDLAVGRLVDNAVDIITAVDAYIAANGVVKPGSALVTGYDFVSDAAEEIKWQVRAGLNLPTCANTNSCITPESLIQPEGLPPSHPSAWNVDQLRGKLTAAGKDDIIVMTGHFAAGSLVAADYKTEMQASEIATAAADYTGSVILALGCHGGFTIPGNDLLRDVSPDPDWAKAFLRRKAAGFVAASGYAYGSTTTIEWGERIFVDLSRQLRTGNDPVPLGKALVRAKQAYLAKWADQLDGYDEKTLTQMTLYGLPMMRVNMPGERLPVETDASIVNSTAPVTTGPGAGFGLNKTSNVAVQPTITINQASLQNLSNNTAIVTTWASGRDGVIVNPFEPLFPRERNNVSLANHILRGIAWRGGDYTDRKSIIPLTEAPTTEISRAHEAFYSDVFYPSQTWLANYFDATGGGPTRLIAVPGQYRSTAPGTVDGTLRTYSRLNFDLYYLPANWADPARPAATKAAAISAAPIIQGVSATESNRTVSFKVNAVADGSAGIQLVTILYTAANGPLYGKWQPLDLARSDPANAPSLWSAALALPSGQNIADFEFVAQAINGAGLTTLATNNGAFYRPAPPPPPTPPAATTLMFEIAPSAGAYLRDASFTLRLTAGGQGLGGRVVLFSLAGQQKFAVTDGNGRATLTIAPKVLPGDYRVEATYRGESAYLASSAASPFALAKDTTTVQLTMPSSSGYDPAVGITATARDSAGRALGGKTLFFVFKGSSANWSKAVVADVYGVARLGATELTGSFSLTAYYNGVIELGNGETIVWPDDNYVPSKAVAVVGQVNQIFLPVITIRR